MPLFGFGNAIRYAFAHEFGELVIVIAGAELIDFLFGEWFSKNDGYFSWSDKYGSARHHTIGSEDSNRIDRELNSSYERQKSPFEFLDIT